MENRDAIGSSENEAVNPQQGKGGGGFSDGKEEALRANQAAAPGGSSSGTSVPEEGGGEDREGRRGVGAGDGSGGNGSLAGGTGGRHVAGRVRQPFSEMNQLESDMALARAIQEQERAFVLLRQSSLRMGFGAPPEFDDHDSHESHEEGGEGDANDEDNVFGDTEEEENGDQDGEAAEHDAHHGFYNEEEEADLSGEAAAPEEVDGSQFESDEAFARALQEAEDRATTARMMALANVRHGMGSDFGSDAEASQDEWDGEHEHEHAAFEDLMLGEGAGVDPDQMSYEELMALSEAVGSESRGLKDADIAALPTSVFATGDRHLSSSGAEQCVVCRAEFEEGDSLITLPCDHYYHQPCISEWLSINKACPMCSAETKPPTAS